MNECKIIFPEFILEEVNLNIAKHEVFIEKLMKDKSIQKEFFLSKEEFSKNNTRRENLLDNNSFIITMEDIPIGYLETSPISNQSISLSFAIERTFRKNGYGTLILTSLTDSLLERDNINRISAIISNKNEISIMLFEKCGFKASDTIPNCFEKTRVAKLKY